MTSVPADERAHLVSVTRDRAPDLASTCASRPRCRAPAGPDVGGRPAHGDRRPRQVGELDVGEPRALAGRRVLVREPGPKISGSSAPSATGVPASTSRRRGTSSGAVEDAERRRSRAGTPRGRRRRSATGPGRGVLDGPHAVPEPVRRQSRRGSPSPPAAPSSSPPCGTSASPARRAIAKAGSEVVGHPSPLVVRQPEPDDGTRAPPAYRAASRASVRASSGCRIRLAATMTATCDGSRPPPTPPRPRRARSRAPA